MCKPRFLMRAFVPKLLLTLLALLSALPAAADCIGPTAEVTSGVVLRKTASSTGQRLGLLKPGQTLPTTGSTAGWTQVTLADGSTAFVSKRWTEPAPCGTATTTTSTTTVPPAAGAPVPLLAAGHPVDWWFVFKLNAAKFPGCAGGASASCPFGGSVQTYAAGQQYAEASSENAHLVDGSGCAGTTTTDPLGATFGEAYNGNFHYVLWNDQFHGSPALPSCAVDCGSPWGHSKGMLVWDDSGSGLVLQVTTPSWPGAGSAAHPRGATGNTLGCVKPPDDVVASQHFFALRLTVGDLKVVLAALANSSVATDPTNVQLVNNGGPADVQALVQALGKKSTSVTPTMTTLSSGVRLISKPSNLNVPPWQLVSSLLGGVPLRTATWWANPQIDSTAAATPVTCWDHLLTKPGAVDVAITGTWDGQTMGMKGTASNGNHAKIGVTTDASSDLAIFGDLNQQGSLSGNCGSSQNGRGGLFFVVKNHDLATGIAALIQGDSAPMP